MEIIKTQKELRRFCRKNNINCVKKDTFYRLEFEKDMWTQTNYSYTFNPVYKVNEVDNKVIITMLDKSIGSTLKATFEWDNKDNQIVAVVGLKTNFTVFIKSNIEHQHLELIFFKDLQGEK